MLVILLILIFIRPFISSLAFPYLNYTQSLVILGFLIIWFIQKGIPVLKIKTLKLPFLFFLVALIISLIFSIDKMNSLKEIYKYIIGILMFLFGISLVDKEKTRVIKVVVLAGFLISLLAIYQYLFGFRHILNYLARDKITSSFVLDYIQRRRVFLPFVTPNTLGGYLIIIIPLILAVWEKNKRLFLNHLFFFLISTSLALLLTQSLGALVSILLGLVVYFYLLEILDKKRLLFIAAVFIIVGLVFILRQSATGQHILPTFSLICRIDYWKDTLMIIKTTPWLGLGPGNFNLVSARYTHNSYLQIWAEMGILGIGSYLWIISAVFKSALKNIKYVSNKKFFSGLITANAVFLIHNLVDFSFFLPEVAFIWWVIVGLSFCSE